MVDFHTHILPGMDDGSKSIRESISMLRMQYRQGIEAVVLSPHFYADENSPQKFLERRQRAWAALKPYLWPELPMLRLGAEVQYFEGICTAKDMDTLRIQGSDLLLLEMPFCHWSDRMIEDVLELNDRRNIRIVLAHIERYLAMQSKGVWQELRDNGVLMQSNVSFFANWRTKHKAMSMLSRGEIHMLGSDCHNKEVRPPNWDLLPEKALHLAQGSAAYLSYRKI